MCKIINESMNTITNSLFIVVRGVFVLYLQNVHCRAPRVNPPDRAPRAPPLYFTVYLVRLCVLSCKPLVSMSMFQPL